MKAHAGPFIFSFVMLMFIFLMQFLMRAVDWLVGKGLGTWVIIELIGLSLSYMVVLAVPMSVLVATLMAFGKLSSQNEFTAMKAAGASLYRMMAPVVLLSILLTLLLVRFNNDILPGANHRLKVLMIDIRRIKPTLTIERGIFSQDLQGYSILARNTDEHSNDLDGVTIYDYTDPTTNVVVTAEKGKVSFTPDYRKLIMDLENGEIHQLNNKDPQAYRRMRFIRHRIIMNSEGFDFERSSENSIDRGDREMSASDMRQLVNSWEHANEESRHRLIEMTGAFPGSMIADPATLMLNDTTGRMVHARALLLALSKARQNQANIANQMTVIDYNNHQINQYLVEIHKKYSIPAACIVFVFLGIPLGVIARRGTFGVAATFSLGFFVLYWAALMGGEKFADRGFMPPWLGMWMGNIILSILGIFLTIRMGRETPTLNLGALRRFLPPIFRGQAPPAEGQGFDRA
jgi:lipopolysaccharide export system permease protein